MGSNIGIIGGSKAGSPVRQRAGMARNLARVEFTTFLEMATHLDGWAADRLTDSAPWEDVLVGSQAWLDYSARNQVLLASYGAEGPVAGAETWRLVPSTTEGRGGAVRAGEHGYPVRVPVTTGGTEPDPYLGGYRPTRAMVSRWEWRLVFSVGQLARRPAPDALVATEVPSSLAGPNAEGEFLAAVHKVAAATVRGRLPKSDDEADPRSSRAQHDGCGRPRSGRLRWSEPVARITVEPAAWSVPQAIRTVRHGIGAVGEAFRQGPLRSTEEERRWARSCTGPKSKLNEPQERCGTRRSRRRIVRSSSVCMGRWPRTTAPPRAATSRTPAPSTMWWRRPRAD